MHGAVLVLFLGLPALISGFWVGNVAYQGNCLVYIFGMVQCGAGIYTYTILGILFFLATLWLAHLWK